MNCWEIIADDLSKVGWSCGCVSSIDAKGRTIWIADAHCDDGKRFVVHADEKLTAFWNWKRRLGLTPWVGHTNKLIGDLFLKNQGLPPIGSRAASITILVNRQSTMSDE